jgi:surface antigen
MIKNFIKKSFAILMILCLASCATKQQTGASVGVGAGALIGGLIGQNSGNGFAGATIGALIGGIAGSAIGHQLDKNDKKLIAKASEDALENAKSGKKVKWNNPDSGHEGSITPIKTYESGNRYCREFVQEVIIGGEKSKAYGKACRKPDGQWEIINSNE